MAMKTSLFKYLSPILAIFFAFSAYADDLQFEGDYIFSWSGIRIGKLHLSLQQDSSAYAVKSSLKTSGIVAMFSDHKSTTIVNGTTKDAIFQPIDYRSDYFSGGKDKLIALKFDEMAALLTKRYHHLSALVVLKCLTS